MAAPAIRLEGLGKAYRIGAAAPRALRDVLGNALRGTRHTASRELLWALRDVSFEVAEGEAIGIIGRNGSGKSTLLKLLSRITAPSEGRATLRGRVAGLLEVGTGFHPDLTGRENIHLNAALLGMSRDDVRRHFDAIVQFAEIERFLDTPVRHYSSGMYVRLAFSVAAHVEPDVLLLDEVLSVGDAGFQRRVLQRMDESAAEQRTMLIVSHDMPVIRRLCARAIRLDGGKIVADGPVEDVIAGYLGSAPDTVFTNPHPRAGPSWEHASVQRAGGGLLSTDAPIRISLAWQLPDDHPGVRVECRVNTRSGVPVFATFPEDAGLRTPTTRGRWRADVEIPPNILMAGEHTLTLALWESGQRLDWHEDAVRFTLEPGPGSVAYQAPDPSRAGVIQLRCPWSVTTA